MNEKNGKETQKKFFFFNDVKVVEAGWTILFESALKDFGGDGENYFLAFEKKGKNKNLSFFKS